MNLIYAVALGMLYVIKLYLYFIGGSLE